MRHCYRIIVVIYVAVVLVLHMSSVQAYSRSLTPYICSDGTSPASTSYSLDVTTVPPGSYTADTLSSLFSNTDGTVFSASYWLPAGMSSAYVRSNNYKDFIVRSRTCSLDVEVDTWTRYGTIFIRLADDGTALFLTHIGETGNGSVSIGVVAGNLANGAMPWEWGGSAYYLWKTDNARVDIKGYNKDDTSRQVFTFGARGVEIYAELNGVEFVRLSDYRHVKAGAVAVKANDGYGIRSVTVRHSTANALFSDFSAGVVDPRDFGLQATTAVGSIQSGSNKLALTASTNFKVGDPLIIEIGTESGKGKPGTRGVGGAWPTRSYTTTSLLLAARLIPDGTYAWAQDTGLTYRFSSQTGTWSAVTNTYFGRAIPKALRATIIGVQNAGKTLVLSSAAQATASKAAIYYDNANVFNKLGVNPDFDAFPYRAADNANGRSLKGITPDGLTIRVPQGSYAVGEKIIVNNRPGVRFEGAGQDATTIFSPKGTPSASLLIANSPNANLARFGLRGNARTSGYGMNFWSYQPDEQGSLVTETNVPQGTAYPAGVGVYRSDRTHAFDLKVIDSFHQAFVSNMSTDVEASRIAVYLTEGSLTYIGWQIQWADSTGGGCTDCSVTSSTLTGGFEAFKSTNVLFDRANATNAVFALNDAGSWIIRNSTVRITTGSQPTNKWFSPNNPMINVNTNISRNFVATGGRIENVTMVHDGYINTSNDLLAGIVVNDANPNVTILGGSYTAPNYAPPSQLAGAQGVRSTGLNTIVDGMTVVGTVNSARSYGVHNANIGIMDGTIRNCVAIVIARRNK